VTLTGWYLMTLNAVLWKLSVPFVAHHPSVLGVIWVVALSFSPQAILHHFSVWRESWQRPETELK